MPPEGILLYYTLNLNEKKYKKRYIWTHWCTLEPAPPLDLAGYPLYSLQSAKTKKTLQAEIAYNVCTLSGVRTLDPLIKSQLLYQLS